MDRRTLLAAGLATAGGLVLPASTPSRALAAAEWALFEWTQPGGFFPPGRGVMVAPPLAVYADGTAYADAAASLRLPRETVEDLRRHALSVLRDPDHVRRDPARPARRDQPVDRVRVRRPGGGEVVASLDAWLDGDPDRAFPAALHSLYDRVQTLRRHVLDAGEPWRPDAVLIAAVRLDVRPDGVRPWPDGLPLPPVDQHYGEVRLRGERAQGVRKLLPVAGEPVWPSYRAPDGSFLAATWRFLLPHE